MNTTVHPTLKTAIAAFGATCAAAWEGGDLATAVVHHVAGGQALVVAARCTAAVVAGCVALSAEWQRQDLIATLTAMTSVGRRRRRRR